MNVNFNKCNVSNYDPINANQAAAEIMKSDWMGNLSDAQLKEDATSKRDGMTISQVQGSIALREKVVNVMETIHPCHGLSLQALRECRHLNENLFSILQQKRLGHALSLVGNGMSGFNETFTIPMLASSLFQFALQNPNEQEKAKAIGVILTNALFNDRSSLGKIKEGFENLNQGIPLMIGSGWDWHITSLTLMKGASEGEYYIIASNRGQDSKSGHAVTGWNVYKVKNIDITFIENLAKRLTHEMTNYISCKELENKFGAKLVYQHEMKSQKAYNCGYTSVKANISALMGLWEITSGFKLGLTDELFTNHELLKRGQLSYKAFSMADKQYVVSDFMIDLKKNPKEERVLLIGKMIYEKFAKFPLMGFKIGWALWLEIIELCEKTDPTCNFLPAEIRSLAKQLVEEDKKGMSPFQQWVQFISCLTEHENLQEHLHDSMRIFNFSIEGFTFSEAEKLINILLSHKNQKCNAEGFAMCALFIKNGHSVDASLELCKLAFKNSSFAMSSAYHADFHRLLEVLIAKGRFDVIHNWMKDPEVRANLCSLLEKSFLIFSGIIADSELPILPYISKGYADLQLWDKSKEIIHKLKENDTTPNQNYYFSALLQLSNRLVKHQKFEEAMDIIAILKKNKRVYQMNRALEAYSEALLATGWY